jgi:periplasmic divalent cation tolerance protein
MDRVARHPPLLYRATQAQGDFVVEGASALPPFGPVPGNILKPSTGSVMARFQIVLVTCGSKSEAGKIAHALVEHRLAACVNVVTAPVESIYRWKGRTESAKEFLLVIKSTQSRFAAMRREIERLHSYEVPEVIAVTIGNGSPKYLKWLAESVSANSRR